MLFSLCMRLQRQFLEVKKTHCAFGLIIRDPRLWNNELNTNQSWSCCWICWSSLDCVNVLQRACSFTADLPVICSYVFDWWWLQCCGSLGKNALFILHFLQSQLRSAGSLIYTGIQYALHQCAPTGSVCWSPALSKLSIMLKFLHKTKEMPSQMWIQILQAHFFLKLLRCSRPMLPHPGANGFADLQRTYRIIQERSSDAANESFNLCKPN